MNKKTLKALKGSIRKWDLIVKGQGEDNQADNCPLCDMFLNEFDCEGCPVKERTRQKGCVGTPYMNFRDALLRDITEFTQAYPHIRFIDALSYSDFKETAVGPRSIAAAEKELHFLRSLLPRQKGNK